MKILEGRKSDFQTDYNQVGLSTEVAVLDRIKKYLDPTAYRLEGYKGKDITAPKVGLSFEVKYGNFGRTHFALEVSDNNKESGITTTTADYWVINAWDKFFVIEIRFLKQLANMYKKGEYQISGNNKKTSLIPIPLKEIETWSELIWD